MEDVSWKDLFHIGTFTLGLSVAIVTFFIRRIVENRWPSLKKLVDANVPGLTYATPMSRWWNEVILYLIPVVLGCALSFTHDPFLFGSITSPFVQFMVGGGVAWFAGTIYKIIRKVLSAKFGVSESLMPPAD